MLLMVCGISLFYLLVCFSAHISKSEFENCTQALVATSCVVALWRRGFGAGAGAGGSLVSLKLFCFWAPRGPSICVDRGLLAD